MSNNKNKIFAQDSASGLYNKSKNYTKQEIKPKDNNSKKINSSKK
ncbi:MAG: hypothetical protein WC145_02395 [Aliarcobacter sp.]|jgi:hypothetical protein|nr:hypothetical protein [Aliarcobacter skirrowii]MDX4027623.1 hypothetical protein [Aliarcobacter skirrowii]